MDKLLGFSPDVDPTTPGVMLDVVNLVPDESGMKGAPSPVNATGAPVLAAPCIGAAVITKLDDTRRIFAGTTGKLYELSAGAWVDVSGAAYAGGADTRWSFAQFGNSTLAANHADPIQRSAGSGAFSSISGAPKAKVIFTVQGFVMALHTDDAGFGNNPDRWWCSAAFNDADWTPSTTTQATTGRLVSATGRLTAGGKLGDYAVAYKERAIYLGQYIGAPAVWDWQEVPGGEAGCVGQEAWCDIGGAHFVVGIDNFWLLDGARPTKIGNGVVRDWFYANSNPQARERIRCAYDKQAGLVWVFFPSPNSQAPDRALVYHTTTQKWGLVDLVTEAVLNYVGAGLTIDGMSSVSPDFEGLAGYSFDSSFWVSGGRSLAIFSGGHQLQTLTGESDSCGYTSGDCGDDDRYSLLSGVRVRFAPGEKPGSGLMATQFKFDAGDALSAGDVSTMSDGRFDVLASARWHRLTFFFYGRATVFGHALKLTPEGSE